MFWVTGLHPRVNRVYVPIPSLPVSLSGVYQLFLFSFLYIPLSLSFFETEKERGCSFSRIIESTRLTIIRRVDQKCIQTREIQERSYGYSDSFLGLHERPWMVDSVNQIYSRDPSLTRTNHRVSLLFWLLTERFDLFFFSFQRRKNCRRISSLDYDLTDERDMVGHWYINPLTGDNLYPVSTSRELFRFLSDP